MLYLHTAIATQSRLNYIKTVQKVASKLAVLLTTILMYLFPLKTSVFLLTERN